jgi:hypothetical protein
LDKRNELYSAASSGTIHDLLNYEETYKEIDANTKALQSRKNKMLYTKEFFDEQTEIYKNNLYKETFQNADSYQLKKDFMQQYADYDPLGYKETIVPQEILEKLIYYEKVANQKQNFYGARTVVDILSFSKSMTVNEAVYTGAKNQATELINACMEDMKRNEKYKDDFSKALSELRNYQDYIETTYRQTHADIENRKNAHARYQQERCANCELDFENSKNKLPEKVDYDNIIDHILFSKNDPGVFYMKNNEKYEYYQNDDLTWYVETSLVSSKTFKTFNELMEYFLKKCIETHCR